VKTLPLYIWQLPQHLLALIILAVYRKKRSGSSAYSSAKICWLEGTLWGVSLGDYIIVSKKYHNELTVRHEYGHTLQSRMLGPLYLLLVGVPSFTMACISALNKDFAKNYYKRWPESWADRLAGIVR
jgi:hypothetical protein